MSLGETLRQLREQANLEEEQLASLLGCDSATVARIEEGGLYAASNLRLIDRWTELFGLSPWELETVDRYAAPSAVLFRAAQDSTHSLIGPEFEDIFRLLGRARRVLRNTGALSDAHLRWRDELQPDSIVERAAGEYSTTESRRDWKYGEALAKATREVLGLGEAPLESMTELLGDLHIVLLPIHLEEPQGFSAAALIDGAAGIVLNCPYGLDNATRNRASLAHELCHLIADRDVLEGDEAQPLLSAMQMAGPCTESVADKETHLQRWINERHQSRERVANAFAAYFLAPRAAVKELLGVSNSASLPWQTALSNERVLKMVVHEFGISPAMALHHIPNVYQLGSWPGLRPDISDRSAWITNLQLPGERDVFSEDEAELPPPWFAKLVIQAVKDRRVSQSRAYALLGEATTRPLGSRQGISSDIGPLRDPVFDAQCRLANWLATQDPPLELVAVDVDESAERTSDSFELRATAREQGSTGEQGSDESSTKVFRVTYHTAEDGLQLPPEEQDA